MDTDQRQLRCNRRCTPMNADGSPALRGPALDENYRQVKAHTYPWPQTE
jgi:hypothetical protein